MAGFIVIGYVRIVGGVKCYGGVLAYIPPGVNRLYVPSIAILANIFQVVVGLIVIGYVRIV
ncbi:hypothetical protein ES703_85766 [subsurface metagenome]